MMMSCFVVLHVILRSNTCLAENERGHRVSGSPKLSESLARGLSSVGLVRGHKVANIKATVPREGYYLRVYDNVRTYKEKLKT